MAATHISNDEKNQSKITYKLKIFIDKYLHVYIKTNLLHNMEDSNASIDDSI